MNQALYAHMNNKRKRKKKTGSSCMLDVAQTEEMLQVLEPTTLPVLAPVTVKSAASASGGG
jgi:hypothetical protein